MVLNAVNFLDLKVQFEINISLSVVQSRLSVDLRASSFIVAYSGSIPGPAPSACKLEYIFAEPLHIPVAQFPSFLHMARRHSVRKPRNRYGTQDLRYGSSKEAPNDSYRTICLIEGRAKRLGRPLVSKSPFLDELV